MSTSVTVQPSSSSKSLLSLPRPPDVFSEMDALYHRIAQRAYDIFQSNGWRDGHDLDDWLNAEGELLKAVPIEMTETADKIVVRAEVPGFSPNDLKVDAEASSILIRGKKEQRKEEKKDKGERTYSEISTTEIYRKIELPAQIDREHVSARLDKGVLEMTLPKATTAKPIEIKAAS